MKKIFQKVILLICILCLLIFSVFADDRLPLMAPNPNISSSHKLDVQFDYAYGRFTSSAIWLYGTFQNSNYYVMYFPVVGGSDLTISFPSYSFQSDVQLRVCFTSLNLPLAGTEVTGTFGSAYFKGFKQISETTKFSVPDGTTYCILYTYAVDRPVINTIKVRTSVQASDVLDFFIGIFQSLVSWVGSHYIFTVSLGAIIIGCFLLEILIRNILPHG